MIGSVSGEFQQVELKRGRIACLAVSLVFLALLFAYGSLRCGVYGFLAWMVAIVLFYLPGVLVFADVRRHVDLWHFGRKQCVSLFFLLIALGVLLFAYVSSEQFIYYWDYGSYWYKTIGFSDSFFLHPLRNLGTVYSSINNDEYNLLISLLLSVPLRLTGGSYASFVVSVYALFIVPSSLLFAVVAGRLSSFALGKHLGLLESKGKPFMPLWLGVLCICFSSLMIIPLVDGYADFASLFMLASILLVIACFDSKRFSAVQVAMTALALLWVVLLRRYFLYAVVGLVVGLVVLYFVAIVQDRKGTLSLTIGMCRSFLMPGLLVVVALALAFPGFLDMVLFNNYAAAYSAYKSDVSLWGEALYVVKNIGLLFVAATVAGSVFLFRRSETRPMASLLIASVLVSCLLFWQTQDMGEQHLLILAPCVFVCSMCFVFTVGALLQCGVAGKPKSVVFSVVVAIVVALGALFSASFIPRNVVCDLLYGNRAHILLVRNDLDEVYAMADSFESGDSVYVLSSSGILNSDILVKSYIKRGIDQECTVLSTSHVDLRDGFPTSFFDANKIVVCVPCQTHMKEGTQHVITDLADYVVDNLGDNYTLIGSYSLDNGVVANVYELTSPYDASDFQMIEETFDAVYPSNQDLFRERIEASSAKYLANN